MITLGVKIKRFNTASGKRRCNDVPKYMVLFASNNVSIPQAVSAVATRMFMGRLQAFQSVSIPQAVSAVATQRINHS